MRLNPASFRDPSGYVVEVNNQVYRIILPAYEQEWQALQENGLLEKALDKGLLEYRILPKNEWPDWAPGNALEVLVSPKLPFISYPYEWCFSQLKAAALLTLDLQLLALDNGFTLKDASAYNVQFMDGKAVFIDLLSFERNQAGKPWDAYGQFCAHFLAPLTLMGLKDERLGKLARLWIDGIPLDLACKLLPLKSKLSPGLVMHMHLHAALQGKYGETGEKNKKNGKRNLTAQQQKDVCESLRRTIKNLSSPARKTEWGDYYTDTNYSRNASESKKKIVEKISAEHPGKIALDIGANTGAYSRLLAPHFDLVLSADIDHGAVEKHWTSEKPENILPLLFDMANPSPAIGWNCEERQNFAERCQADFVTALAVIHHLRITAGIPVRKIAQGIAALLKEGGTLILEFVPKTDSQIRRLLSRRDDVFRDYSLDNTIEEFVKSGMEFQASYEIDESERKLLIFKKV